MFYSSYFVYILPALILAMFAQSRIRSAYAKYSQVRTRSGLTGAEVAQKIMRNAGITDVGVELSKGRLSDHFDPRSKVVRLSSEVYHGNSVAAFGIAAHEVGHVLQHQRGYAPIQIRNGILPVVQLGSGAAMPLFIVGLLFNSGLMLNIGIILFSAVVVFHFVTLPVEFNASNRAIAVLEGEGYLQPQEIQGVKKVLRAAAFTYVASAIMAVAQLLRLLALSSRRR